MAYIHYNPVKAKLCASYEKWEHSSYQLIQTRKLSTIRVERALQQFGGLEEFFNFHNHYDKFKKPDL